MRLCVCVCVCACVRMFTFSLSLSLSFSLSLSLPLSEQFSSYKMYCIISHVLFAKLNSIVLQELLNNSIVQHDFVSLCSIFSRA